jgi:PKD repeat protein
MRRTRRSAFLVAAVLLGLLVPGIAHAAPPANDDFDQAVSITTSPFTTTQSVAEATQGADDPNTCYGTYHSVWFTYTAPSTGILTATTAGSRYDTVLSAYSGFRGSLTSIFCNDDVGGTPQSRIEFPVVAGTRYHFMVGSYLTGQGGELTFSTTLTATTPSNDAFADATPVTALPHTATADLSTATVEPGEPGSVCGPSPKSLWYAVTLPETTPVTLTPSTDDARLTLYTGPDLAGLTEVNCTWFSTMTFRATAGTTYYVRLSAGSDSASAVRLLVDVARPIVPHFSYSPTDPSAYSDIAFYNYTEVPDSSGPVTTRWDFGDGTTSEARAWANHRYAADGDYTVTLTMTAADGRTATMSLVVPVRTHDVAISRFTTPGSAAVGTTKRITVRIANPRYAEEVTVTLYRSTPSGWGEVGHYTQYVPASATGAVNFPFNYTFRPDDAAYGKVNFRAVATLAGLSDAQPLDNEAISATTLVQPVATGGLDLD